MNCGASISSRNLKVESWSHCRTRLLPGELAGVHPASSLYWKYVGVYAKTAAATAGQQQHTTVGQREEQLGSIPLELLSGFVCIRVFFREFSSLKKEG